MAELRKNRFLIFVSLMIFQAHALDVILSSAHGDFKQKSEIKTEIINGEKIYNGTLNQLAHYVRPSTAKVIVYIIGRSRFVEIMRNAVRQNRSDIVSELSRWNCELVFLGIENFDDDEYKLIGAFMGDKIQRRRNQRCFTIQTIGENHFDQFYQSNEQNFTKYLENDQICGGNLLARLRSIPHGALRPVEIDDKEIRLCEFQNSVDEVKWPVTVKHGTYLPYVDLTHPRYNLRMRHPQMDIYLVILSGKEYLEATKYQSRSLRVTEVGKILMEMSLNNNEVMIILGAFNFDWTEVDILTEIILCHTMIQQDSNHYVYTYGFGMFNTIYLNMKNDGKFLLQKPNSNVAEVMKVLLGEEVKHRSIDVYYTDNGWQHLKIPITLVNGRYHREQRFDNFSLPWPNQRIAFIVHESAERITAIDHPRMWRSVDKLKGSGIHVVVIETTNFDWYDAHIIAEWIDLHKGYVHSEQIAVLGGGIFDTIFQSSSTTYNTLFNVKKNDLKRIRNTFVKSGNGKRVFAAKIENLLNFQVWSYPMNTINGFYEPDLIPDTNMLDAGLVKKIFFIVTSAQYFHQILTVDNGLLAVTELRQELENEYPMWQWSVVLVGLDNFEEKDYHLFAELVKMQIKDRKGWKNFVCTFNYGISQAMYHYKDNVPLTRATRPQIWERITTRFGNILMTDDA